jgi:porphyrinogen peroxidase
MLQNMFVGRPPGNYDRLLDFSRAVTGNLFFVPSATFLDDVSDEPPADAAPAADAQATDETRQSAPSNKDGSLGIGSLKGEIGHE